jgi:hypothetical protein
MSSVDKAVETQLKNIQTKTGKTLDQLYAVIKKSGLAKHGEIRDMLKKDLGLGHGDANTVVHFYMKSTEPSAGQAKSSSPDAAQHDGYRIRYKMLLFKSRSIKPASLSISAENLFEMYNVLRRFDPAPAASLTSQLNNTVL